LQALNRCLAEAREGRCRLAVAVGEAGVGKSHLLDRFLGDVGSYDAVGLVARGRRSERSLSLALWADLLSRGKLADDAELDQLIGTAMRGELAPFRSDRFPTAGEGGGGGHDRRRLYDAVVELIRARSAQQPLVLVFDDLQWADEQSLQLIAFAVRHLAGAPVLFVASTPSDAIARGPLSDLLRDLERDGLLSLITLRPLSREETGELVRRLQQRSEAKSEPKLRSSEVWALSEGNPQIIVETLAENAEREGTARGHKPRLPKRVFTEVSRALVSLGESARELANTASVIGPRVDYEVLRRSADLDQEAAVRGVEELVAAQILEPDGDDLVFTRKRVRLALYESLLPQRRRALHAAAARAIEETHADALEPHFEVLAHHYREAGDGAKGLECELAAGVVELKRGAWNSARKLFQRSLKSLRGLARDAGAQALEVDARLGLGMIAETEQDLATAAAIFSDLESHFDRIENPQRRVATLLALSRIRYMRKDVDDAYDYARRALAEAGRAGGDCIWPPADYLLTRFHLINGALDRTADELKKRQERTRKLQLGEDESDTTAALGVLYALKGDFSAAAAECQRAIESAESLGNERCLAASLQFRGMVRMWRGSFDDALADFDKAADIAADRGDLLRLYTLFGHRGFALAAARRYDEAMAAFRSALDMATRLNTKTFRPLFMAWMAEASFELGRHEEALRGGREACQMAAASNQTWARSVALRTLARVLAHPEVRDLSGAEKSIRSALADQEGLGIKFETARSMVVQAKIMRSAGRTRQSSAVYNEASKLFQQMQMTSEFDSASHMAEALRPGGDSSA
jgi:tetratricopeptide (TPR) repeat protein